MDELPADVNFDVSQSELRLSEASGLSQDLGAYSIDQFSLDAASAAAEDDLSAIVTPPTPNTSVTGGGAFKRPRGEGNGKERKQQSPN